MSLVSVEEMPVGSVLNCSTDGYSALHSRHTCNLDISLSVGIHDAYMQGTCVGWLSSTQRFMLGLILWKVFCFMPSMQAGALNTARYLASELHRQSFSRSHSCAGASELLLMYTRRGFRLAQLALLSDRGWMSDI